MEIHFKRSELVEVNGISIVKKESEALKSLENVIKRHLTVASTVDYSVVGFMVENNHVIALGLYGCNLNAFPRELFVFSRLRKLNLWNNQIQEIPPSIDTLKHLENLNLEANQLANLPDELFSLPMKKLYLGDNKLTVLPEGIGNFKGTLTYLNLYKNKLTTLPKALFTLTLLETLGLSHNNLERIPDDLLALRSLVRLTLEGMNLIYVPDTLDSLPKLIELYR
ncbi:MAG: leucine-rich repeat domain-containing protein [Candidatus Hodarchaeota archaeon]